MEFSTQEYWSEFPLPSPGDLSHLGIEPSWIAGRFFTIWATRKDQFFFLTFIWFIINLNFKILKSNTVRWFIILYQFSFALHLFYIG